MKYISMSSLLEEILKLGSGLRSFDNFDKF